jgi:hypothetical protein
MRAAAAGERVERARSAQIELRAAGRDDEGEGRERSVQLPTELAVTAEQQDGRAPVRRHDHSGRKTMRRK